MFKTDPGKDRQLLGFQEVVLSAFEFLVKEYGFHCIESDITFVRYESERTFVNVYHGRASFEIGVEIGRLYPEEKYSIGEIMELFAVREKTSYTFFQASTKERVEKFVPEIAEYVKNYAAKALLGDEDTYKQLRELQSKISDQYLKSINLGQIRQEAERAWHEKNYVAVVKLYKSIHEDLHPSERKKIEYAKKQTLKGKTG